MPTVACAILSCEVSDCIQLEADTKFGEAKAKAVDHMQQVVKFAAGDQLDTFCTEFYPGRCYLSH
jgi:hypothetical protein